MGFLRIRCATPADCLDYEHSRMPIGCATNTEVCPGCEAMSITKSPNNGLVRTVNPRHASCLRTCRASGRLSAQP